MGCSDVIKFGVGAATAHGKARAKPCFVPGIFLVYLILFDHRKYDGLS